MAISATCQRCGKTYKVREELAGRRVKCKACDASLTIPAFDDLDFDDTDETETAAVRPGVVRAKSKAAKSKTRPAASGGGWNGRLVGIAVTLVVTAVLGFFGLGRFGRLADRVEDREQAAAAAQDAAETRRVAEAEAFIAKERAERGLPPIPLGFRNRPGRIPVDGPPASTMPLTTAAKLTAAKKASDGYPHVIRHDTFLVIEDIGDFTQGSVDALVENNLRLPWLAYSDREGCRIFHISGGGPTVAAAKLGVPGANTIADPPAVVVPELADLAFFDREKLVAVVNGEAVRPAADVALPVEVRLADASGVTKTFLEEAVKKSFPGSRTYSYVGKTDMNFKVWAYPGGVWQFNEDHLSGEGEVDGLRNTIDLPDPTAVSFIDLGLLREREKAFEKMNEIGPPGAFDKYDFERRERLIRDLCASGFTFDDVVCLFIPADTGADLNSSGQVRSTDASFLSGHLKSGSGIEAVHDYEVDDGYCVLVAPLTLERAESVINRYEHSYQDFVTSWTVASRDDNERTLTLEPAGYGAD
ncbi:MAG: hypothetical protein AAF532_06820 [Planctomycetota bacterium]